MMRRLVLLASFLACASVAPRYALARYEGNVNLFLGEKIMSKGDWEPVDQQPEIGVAFAFGIERAPVHLAIDLFASKKSSTVDVPGLGSADVSARTREFSLGIRKVWKPGHFRPFLGAGGCIVNVDLSVEAPGFHQSNQDNAYGVWVEGGLMWRIGEHVNLGLDARYSHADASFTRNGLPTDVAAGGVHAGLIVGYGW